MSFDTLREKQSRIFAIQKQKVALEKKYYDLYKAEADPLLKEQTSIIEEVNPLITKAMSEKWDGLDEFIKESTKEAIEADPETVIKYLKEKFSE